MYTACTMYTTPWIISRIQHCVDRAARHWPVPVTLRPSDWCAHGSVAMVPTRTPPRHVVGAHILHVQGYLARDWRSHRRCCSRLQPGHVISLAGNQPLCTLLHCCLQPRSRQQYYKGDDRFSIFSSNRDTSREARSMLGYL